MGDLSADEAALVKRLVEIIATEGLVHPERLDPGASLEADLGLSLDDLTLIGNAVEREFDCDMVPDGEMEACRSVRQLVDLIVGRIAAKSAPELPPESGLAKPPA